MTAYKSQMTEQFMGYCYKNELLKYSVVGVSLKEFTFKPLSPSLNLSTENFKNFFFFLGKERKKNNVFFCIKINAFETYHPIPDWNKKKINLPSEAGHQFSSTEQKPPCQHLQMQHIKCSYSSYFILCIKALVGGEKKQRVREGKSQALQSL